MRSSVLPSLLTAMVAAGCLGGVDDLGLAAPPLAQVQGRVDLAAVLPLANGAPLRAALVWGAVPNYSLGCLMYRANPELAAACPDPFSFVPGSVESEAEISLAGDGSFQLPIRRLPPAGVAVGDETTRISWGSVIVAADSNGNGLFDLLDLNTGKGPRHQLADRVVAASFQTLEAPQQRVTFREGGYDAQSTFYPALGCAPPPAGFSLLFTALPGPAQACGSVSLSHWIEPIPVGETQARRLACSSLDTTRVREPDQAPNLTGAEPPKVLCLDAQTLALVYPGECPRITFLPLKGCGGWPLCRNPEWDRTNSLPEWWPCGK